MVAKNDKGERVGERKGPLNGVMWRVGGRRDARAAAGGGRGTRGGKKPADCQAVENRDCRPRGPPLQRTLGTARQWRRASWPPLPSPPAGGGQRTRGRKKPADCQAVENRDCRPRGPPLQRTLGTARQWRRASWPPLPPPTSRSLSLPSLSCCSPGAAAPPPPLLLSAHAHVPECLVRELGGGEGWCWVRGRCSTTARLRRQRQTWQDKRAWWQSAGQVPVKPSVRAMT